MNILSIDDDKDFCYILKRALSQYKVSLKTTDSQDQFFSSFNGQRPDLCLIDINLSETGEGKEIIEKLKQRDKFNTPILALSRINNQDEIDKIISLGANDFISKPLDKFVLTNKINMILGEAQESYQMSMVPSSIQQCSVELSVNLFEINTKGLILKSRNLVAVGSYINISGPLLERYGLFNQKVKVSWVEKKEDVYILGIDFDKENKGLISKIKAEIIQREMESKYRYF